MAHAAPYKTITDPELIRKKNELRKAVSEEYIKQTSNPYRNIKMEGGTLVRMRNLIVAFPYFRVVVGPDELLHSFLAGRVKFWIGRYIFLTWIALRSTVLKFLDPF